MLVSSNGLERQNQNGPPEHPYLYTRPYVFLTRTHNESLPLYAPQILYDRGLRTEVRTKMSYWENKIAEN
jgi:hypothetical protein